MASPTIESPTGLTATAAAAPFAVTLSWSAPGADAEILGYEFFRDYLEIAAVSADTKTYIAHNVFPGKSFTYEVITGALVPWNQNAPRRR